VVWDEAFNVRVKLEFIAFDDVILDIFIVLL
jgi:hypothetical protein